MQENIRLLREQLQSLRTSVYEFKNLNMMEALQAAEVAYVKLLDKAAHVELGGSADMYEQLRTPYGAKGAITSERKAIHRLVMDIAKECRRGEEGTDSTTEFCELYRFFYSCGELDYTLAQLKQSGKFTSYYNRLPEGGLIEVFEKEFQTFSKFKQRRLNTENYKFALSRNCDFYLSGKQLEAFKYLA